MTKTTKKSAVGHREHIKKEGRQEGIQQYKSFRKKSKEIQEY